MNNEFSSLERKLEEASARMALSVSEKDLGRARLREHMAAMPAPKRTVPFLAHGFRFAFALLLIVAVGGGAASAAENALPGSILYPLKTQITEPVRAAFAFAPEARADFAVERANRRLEEYAQVSDAGSADEETTASLAAALANHVDEATDAIRDLATAGDAIEALDATSDLHSILEAHASVLDQITEDGTSTPQAAADVGEALDNALADTSELSDTLEGVVASTGADDVASALDAKEEELQALIDDVRGRVEDAVSTLDASDELEVSGELSSVAALMEEARSLEEQGDLASALAVYAKANEELNRLGVLLQADVNLDIDIAAPEDAPLP